MDVSKFKIWDLTRKEFAKDPTPYVIFESYFSVADRSIHAYPSLRMGINHAVLLRHTGKVDSDGIDIFEGDRIRFFCVSQDQYLQETVSLRSGLFWGLGGSISFEDALLMQIIGHRFDGKEDSDQFKLFHGI